MCRRHSHLTAMTYCDVIPRGQGTLTVGAGQQQEHYESATKKSGSSLYFTHGTGYDEVLGVMSSDTGSAGMVPAGFGEADMVF